MSNSVTPWTVASLSMEFSRQEYWSGLPFPFPGDLPDPGIEPESPASPASAGEFFTTEPPEKPYLILKYIYIYISNSKNVRLLLKSRLKIYFKYDLRIEYRHTHTQTYNIA